MASHALSDICGINPQKRSYMASDKWCLPYCNVGLEVELEGLPVRSRLLVSPYWATVNDGSLRDGGAEWKFSEPLFGKDIELALFDMDAHIKKLRNKPTTSSRTSVHVHLDVRDMDTQQLATLLAVYAIFEKTFIHYHGGTRSDNAFATPWYKTQMYYLHAGTALFNESIGVTTDLLQKFSKYSALNIKSLFAFGTIEFRHMPGCYDIDKIAEWIDIIMHLKKHAMETPDFDLFSFPQEVSMSGPVQLLETYFGKYADVLFYDDIYNDMIDGARRAQDIYIGGNKESIDLSSIKPKKEYIKTFNKLNPSRMVNVNEVYNFLVEHPEQFAAVLYGYIDYAVIADDMKRSEGFEEPLYEEDGIHLDDFLNQPVNNRGNV